ncbi:hypothetical protein O6H91_Y377100 [Diphasiastrum complanatum]|nr:hypothetical protein O6H91_Y377100 [Diphasiastrum complanatum]
MSGKKKGKEEEGKGGMAEALERDALLAIFELLPARALASAACVCRSWYYGVQTICSRPCIVSALSLQPNLKFAMEEVLEKVLAQPFRPQFAILFAGQKFNLSKISYMLKSNLPGGIVVIGCHAAGLIGLDVATNKQKEGGVSAFRNKVNNSSEKCWTSFDIGLLSWCARGNDISEEFLF